MNIPIERRLKDRFDALQAYVSWRLHRKVAQWELVELLISPDPEVRALIERAIRATTPPRRPKAKAP